MLDMEIPEDRLHLEDIEIGRTVTFGHKVVSKDEIIAFAQEFDPQLMHLDEEAAKQSIVGGLCASGFHSCAMLMRILAEDLLNHSTSQGSPGIDDVRWFRPIRPGDTLSARLTCTAKRAFASRPHIGLAKLKIELLNQKGDVVMSWDSNQLLRVRNPSPPSEVAPREPRPEIVSLWDLPGTDPVPDANYFEDRRVGDTYSLGTYTFTPERSLAFARDYDPQPFHLDEAAAKASLFGGLTASGWHTTAVWIGQFVRWRQATEASMRAKGLTPAQYGPSPGFKNLRWLKPVYHGDTLEYRGRVVEMLDWKSRPDRGLIVTDNQARNQKGEIVFAIRGQILAERRKPL